jgi:polysaccharide biosynthesis protein PslH
MTAAHPERHRPRSRTRSKIKEILQLRLLLLTSNLPWPMEVHGGAQRTALLLEALRKFSEVDIAFVSWSNESVELARQAREKAERIVGLFYVPDHGSQSTGLLSKLPLVGRPFRAVHRHLARYQVDAQFAAWLKETVHDGSYDGVVSRYLWPGAVGGLVHIRDVPTLLDWDDLDHLKLKSQIEISPWSGIGGFAAKFLTLRKMTKYCLAEAASYDHIWVAKTIDVARIVGKSVSVLPNIPFVDNAPERSVQMNNRRDILFVGNLTYLPNSDALTKFLQRVWPRVHADCPNARVLAIGPPPFADVRTQWERVEGVTIVGAVPSLLSYFQDAALSICPVEWGGGSNIKAVESLGYGVPCVVSPYTFSAFREHFGSATGMICAPSDDEYALACIELLRNRERSAEIGRAGQKVARSLYSKGRFQELVREGVMAAYAVANSRLSGLMPKMSTGTKPIQPQRVSGRRDD